MEDDGIGGGEADCEEPCGFGNRGEKLGQKGGHALVLKSGFGLEEVVAGEAGFDSAHGRQLRTGPLAGGEGELESPFLESLERLMFRFAQTSGDPQPEFPWADILRLQGATDGLGCDDTEVQGQVVQTPFDFIVRGGFEGVARLHRVRSGFGQSGEEDLIDKRGAGADAEDLVLGQASALEVGESHEEEPGDAGQLLALGREPESLAVALGEWDLKEVFELFDLAAVLALSDRVGAGGADDAAGGADFDQRTQPVEGESRGGEEANKHDFVVWLHIVIQLSSLS